MREAHLRDFIAVIETGSVRSAARKLGLTQAAVSKNLTALERALGVPLLVRSSQGVEPTEPGRVVLRRARVVESELRKLQEEIDSLTGHAQGMVTVGLSATAEALLLPRALAHFHAQTHGALVSLRGGRSTTTIAALREGKVDFAIGPLPPGEDATDLHVERLCSSDLGVVLRPGHPLAQATHIAQLADCGWVFAVRNADGEPQISALFREQGLPEPRLAAHCDAGSALVSILLQSDLTSLTSLAALDPLLEQGVLKALPLKLALPPVVQHLITSAARPLTSAAELLASEFRRASRGLRR